MRKRLEYLCDLPKSLVFNLRYFGLTGFRLPVTVSRRVSLRRLRGTVVLQGSVRRGVVTIGRGDVSIFDRRYERTIWSNEGSVIFEGRARLGHGTRLAVIQGGTLVVGDGTLINAASTVICAKHVVLGKDTLMSWRVELSDTDFHDIVYDGADRDPGPDDVVLGDGCWIASGARVLKGTELGPSCVVAADAVVTAGRYPAHVLLAGNPARIIRTGVTWKS